MSNKCMKMITHSKRGFATFNNPIIERNITQKFQKLRVFQQVCTARYLWGIPYISTSSIERLLHNHYYELTKLLCDSTTSLSSLRDNFDDEIFEFILERGSHPGIPLFHSYRQHQLSSFDDGFISPRSIHVQLTNLSLSLHCSNHIVYNEHNDKHNDTNDENDNKEDVNALKERLSKIYQNKEALEEAIKKLNIDEKASTHLKTKSVKKGSYKKDKKIEFNVERMNDEGIPVHLETSMYIYHGSENDRIDDIIMRKGFEPSLVSDVININAADWNRLFDWKLISQTPIGYIECNKDCDKLKMSLDKLLENDVDDNTEWIDVLKCYRASKYFRLQSTNNISLWKVLEANETTL